MHSIKPGLLKDDEVEQLFFSSQESTGYRKWLKRTSVEAFSECDHCSLSLKKKKKKCFHHSQRSKGGAEAD